MAVIVEGLESGSAAERAGLRPVDRLLSYQEQPLISPAMLLALEENTFDVARVTLQGEREGRLLEWEVEAGKLGIEARPELSADVRAEYERGREALQAQQVALAAQTWSDAAEGATERAVGGWLYMRAGEAWESVPDGSAAQAAYERAAALLEAGDDTAAQSTIAMALGRRHQNQNDFQTAAQWYAWAQQADERANRPLWAVRNLNNLGRISLLCGDLTSAQEHLARAREAGERCAPGSLELALTFHGLGRVAYHQGDLILARDHSIHALRIREKLAPASKEVADSLNNLGAIAADLGDNVLAKGYHVRALAIRERLDPDSLDVAMSVMNLGGIAFYEGDLDLARKWFLRSHHIYDRLAPGSLGAANNLNNLGLIAAGLGDLDLARDQHLRALAIREGLAPSSVDVAVSLFNLGSAFLKNNDVKNEDLNNEDLAAARDYFARALAIRERLAFGSLDHANALEVLGKLALRENRQHEAEAHFQQAVDIVELQRERVPAIEARALLFAQHTGKYAGLLGRQLALDKTKEAFATLERARARALLELLADRSLNLADDAPPHLIHQQDELDRERAEVYDQLRSLSIAAENEAQIDSLRIALTELDHRQQDLSVQMRLASPYYASLQYPTPLSFDEARAELEPGTLLLAYLVDEQQTFLFAVTSNAIEAHSLDVGRKDLQEQVRSFRNALHREAATRNSEQAISEGRLLYEKLIGAAAKSVSTAKRLLLCPDGPLHTLPFGALVTNSGRQPRYLGSEKPLHSILSMTLYARMREQERTETRQGRTSARRLLAVGDPLYSSIASNGSYSVARSGAAQPESLDSPAESVPLNLAPDNPQPGVDVELSTLQTRGLRLEPLPHTRKEVLGVAELFKATATVRLGAEATKTAVLKESGNAELLHFACHGWLDSRAPLSSALVLSQPEALGEQAPDRDNGLLQAWEIFQKLKLRADLVVLSACNTGLGQELRGEGLIGLTRAFQYAGAKSLVVSLWEIPDESTATFMKAFYTALKEGVSKDEALQEGIRTLQAVREWKYPYHWSAFVLIGGRN